MTYSPLYVQFLKYFNIDRDYYECHEVMEELWLEEGRSTLYQGLLQVAVGLYHHHNGNISGAAMLMEGAVSKLHPYPDEILGIDLGKVKEEASVYLTQLYKWDESPFDPYDLTIKIIDPELAELVKQC